MKKELFERIGYTDRILDIFGRGAIVVLTGQRRVGKSCVMKYIISKLSENETDNVIYIDKEDFKFAKIIDSNDLYSYVNDHIVEGKRNCLFIDEVQMITDFERTVLSFQSTGTCEIMITGSNSKMLSGDLATVLRGRYVEFRIRSLNYVEFLQFHNLQDNKEALDSYLQWGGLPQLKYADFDKPDQAKLFLRSIYDTVVLRDVVERQTIRNIQILKSLLMFVSDNIGKQFSARSIANFIKSLKLEASITAITNYMSYLCDAYIINSVPRFDIHGKRIFELGDKYYFDDVGLRNVIATGDRSHDIEKVLENVVYQHLCRMGYEVFVGQAGKAEIDFVARGNDSVAYVQVCYLLATEETYNREFGNLKLIKDSFPKYVVSMDTALGYINDDGIRQLYIGDFLKKTKL